MVTKPFLTISANKTLTNVQVFSHWSKTKKKMIPVPVNGSILNASPSKLLKATHKKKIVKKKKNVGVATRKPRGDSRGWTENVSGLCRIEANGRRRRRLVKKVHSVWIKKYYRCIDLEPLKEFLAQIVVNVFRFPYL